jgi:hypothetical protein
MEWQPIETAPKGKRILVCVPIVKHRLVIALQNDFGMFLDEQMQPMQYPPFWWMPLPEAPNAAHEPTANNKQGD